MADQNGNSREANNRPACAACKNQRKRCWRDKCVMWRHFPASKSKEFEAVHKIFGVKNVTNMLKPVPEQERGEIAESVYWEAEQWEKNPVCGPYGEYKRLEAELEEVKECVRNLKQQQQIRLQSTSSPQMINGFHPVWTRNGDSAVLVGNSPANGFTSLLQERGGNVVFGQFCTNRIGPHPIQPRILMNHPQINGRSEGRNLCPNNYGAFDHHQGIGTGQNYSGVCVNNEQQCVNGGQVVKENLGTCSSDPVPAAQRKRPAREMACNGFHQGGRRRSSRESPLARRLI